MTSVILIARALLAVVFATASAAKLFELTASRDTVEAFGIPKQLARYAGTALPFAELLTAIALVPAPSARWGAVAALLLLVVFNAGVAYALSQGRTPDCNCFGQVSSAQISWRTLARNGVLVLVAALIVWKAPGASLSGWTHDLAAANLVAGLTAIIALLLAVTAFYFQQRTAAAPAAEAGAGDFGDALLAGEIAPDFELTDLDGATVTRDALLAGGLPLILIFASPTCGPCQALMPELARWHSALNERLTLVMIESGVGKTEALKQQIRSVGEFPVLVEPGRDMAVAYRANATPTGIAISPEGRIASPPLPGHDQIESLIRIVLRTGGAPPTTPRRALAGQPG